MAGLRSDDEVIHKRDRSATPLYLAYVFVDGMVVFECGP